MQATNFQGRIAKKRLSIRPRNPVETRLGEKTGGRSARPELSPMKRLLQLDLRPVETSAAATSGASVFVLLPTLGQLVGRPDFGASHPICLPDAARPFEPAVFFATYAVARRVH